MRRYTSAGGLALRSLYAIELEKEDDATHVYFLSKIHVNKRSKVGPAYGSGFTDEEILKDVLPYIHRRFGTDVTLCPHCGR